MYDIVGDIHGFADTLELLLQKLGYKKSGGAYQHPSRQLIFTGDFIDRGPKIRKTLQIVTAMTEAGAAKAVAGNHEYNAIAYSTQDKKGNYLRPHNEKNQAQFHKTQSEFLNHPEEWESYLVWFRKLPLYIDLPDLRIVHACWDFEMLKLLKTKPDANLLNPEFINESSQKDKQAYKIIDTLLKGKEVSLPEGYSFRDKDNHRRTSIRFKWWETLEGKTYKTAVVQGNHDVPDMEIPKACQKLSTGYGADEKPVFFGHYWLTGNPRAQKHNVCCLDYSIGKCKKLTAYRFDGEQQIDDRKFVSVKCTDKI
jgi:hypothetical protein